MLASCSGRVAVEGLGWLAAAAWPAWPRASAAGLGALQAAGDAHAGTSAARGMTSGTAADPRGRPDRAGARYGVRLRQRSPHLFRRMRTILGYYDQPAAERTEQPPRVDSVTISLLQTMRYLPLGEQLKQRLLGYKAVTLSREAEGVHAATRALLAQLQPPRPKEAKQALPAFMAKQQARKEGGGGGST